MGFHGVSLYVSGLFVQKFLVTGWTVFKDFRFRQLAFYSDALSSSVQAFPHDLQRKTVFSLSFLAFLYDT